MRSMQGATRIRVEIEGGGAEADSHRGQWLRHEPR